MELGPLGDRLEVTVNLGRPFMMHCFLMVQDLFDNSFPADHPESSNEWVQNVEVYIGNSPDYILNKRCPGGPFMRTDDPNSYSNGQYTLGSVSGDL